MTNIRVRFKELRELHKIALKISPVDKGHSFSTVRTYYAETILSKAVLTVHSYLRLSPPINNGDVDYHNYDISSLCSLSRNFIELNHVYNYMCKDKVCPKELEFRAHLMSVHYANEMKKILVPLGFSKDTIENITFFSGTYGSFLLKENEFFDRLDPAVRDQFLKGEKAFYRDKGKSYLMDKEIEKSLYKLFSNHIHSFKLGLNVVYSDKVPINFISVYFLSVEAIIFLYANMLKSYLVLRWKISKKILTEEKKFINACATDNKIKTWIENQKKLKMTVL